MRELTDTEVGYVSGGGVEVQVNWTQFMAGMGLIGLGVAIAGTAGLAGIGVPIILGAGTAFEIGVGGVCVGLAGGGGLLSGSAVGVGWNGMGGDTGGGGSDRIH